MKKQFHLTKDGVDELKKELDELVSRRGDVAERIKAAREFGDLAENAEYTSAREEQGTLESRVAEIENILQSVEIIKKPRTDGVVRLGSKVELKNDGKKKSFQIVGTVEADPMNGKISDESPIGKTLMSKNVGDKVEIETPTEKSTYKIVAIS